MGDKQNYYNKIYAPGVAHLIHEKDAKIAESDAEIERLKGLCQDYHAEADDRDAEIERLTKERDHHIEYAKSAKRESTFWWNKSEWDRWQLYKAGLAHEKREAALQMQIARLEQSVSDMSSDYHRAFNENMAYLAFVEADDRLSKIIKIQPRMQVSTWDLACSVQDKKEAREQLRSVIDGQ